MTYNGNAARPSITWDRPKLEAFKEAYKQARRGAAVPSGKLKAGSWNPESTVMFEFDGHEFVLGYAKYLIEFLEGQLTTTSASGNVGT